MFWQIYDDLVEYRKNPDRQSKEAIRRGFDEWVTTQVDDPELRAVLGKLMVIRESLLDFEQLPLMQMPVKRIPYLLRMHTV